MVICDLVMVGVGVGASIPYGSIFPAKLLLVSYCKDLPTYLDIFVCCVSFSRHFQTSSLPTRGKQPSSEGQTGSQCLAGDCFGRDSSDSTVRHTIWRERRESSQLNFFFFFFFFHIPKIQIQTQKSSKIIKSKSKAATATWIHPLRAPPPPPPPPTTTTTTPTHSSSAPTNPPPHHHHHQLILSSTPPPPSPH